MKLSPAQKKTLFCEVSEGFFPFMSDAGVVGGCEQLCSLLDKEVDNNQLVDVVCNLLCDYVGIKEFINIIEKSVPSPICSISLTYIHVHVLKGHHWDSPSLPPSLLPFLPPLPPLSLSLSLPPSQS